MRRYFYNRGWSNNKMKLKIHIEIKTAYNVLNGKMILKGFFLPFNCLITTFTCFWWRFLWDTGSRWSQCSWRQTLHKRVSNAALLDPVEGFRCKLKTFSQRYHSFNYSSAKNRAQWSQLYSNWRHLVQHGTSVAITWIYTVMSPSGSMYGESKI